MPADRIEQQVERERANASAQKNAQNGHDAIPEDAGLDHPALKAHKEKLESRHRQAMRELSDKQKELDRQFQQLSMNAAMMSQQQQHHAPGRGEPLADDEYSWLPPSTRDTLRDPTQGPIMRELFKAFDSRYRAKDDSRVKQLEDTIGQLSNALQQTQQAVTLERYQRQIPQFRDKYAGDLDEDQQQAVIRYALERGVDLEDALVNTHRGVFEAQLRKRIEQDVREKIQRDYGAELEGMRDFFSGESRADAPVVTKEGKMASFADTARHVLGPMGMARAMRDGYSNEPAAGEPTQG